MPDAEAGAGEEIRYKLSTFLLARYGGEDAAAMRRMFADYDGDRDGALNYNEIARLFADADIGGALRPVYVSAVINKMDRDGTRTLTYQEIIDGVGLVDSGAPPSSTPPPMGPPPPPSSSGLPPALLPVMGLAAALALVAVLSRR